MSLINDALKRARQAQQKHSPTTVPVARLRPVDVGQPRGAGSSLWLPIALAALLVLVLAVGWAVGWGGAGKTIVFETSPKTRAAPAITPRALINTPPPTQTKPEPALASVVPRAGSPASGQAASPPPSPVTVAAVETPATVPPWPKLQGIFYRSAGPSALLNGKTVLIGERSGDFLVVAIDRQSVTLVRAGVTNVSRLSE